MSKSKRDAITHPHVDGDLVAKALGAERVEGVTINTSQSPLALSAERRARFKEIMENPKSMEGRGLEIARAMYDAYGDNAGWKNFAGAPMPTWDDLPPSIRDNWNAAAPRAIDLLYNPQ